MKKFISLISAAVFSATLVLPQTLAFSVAAEESALEESTVFDAAAAEANPFQATGTANTLPYQLRFVPERNFVTAEEVAAGDVVIPAAVYISGSTANRFGSVMVKYDAFRNDEKTDSVYFSGISTGDNAHRTSEKKTYNSSQGTFTTDYVPYCFGSVYDDEYDSNSPMFTTREYACDPIFGSTITSAGKNKIKFNASFYNSADERKNGVKKTNKDFIADVTVDENGNGVYSYDYIDQSSFQTITKTATLPRYNPDTPEGEKLPDTCNSVMWVAGTSQLKDGAEFLGSTSDEFPLFHVNIVISKGTASGIYDVQFLTRETVGANEAPTQLTSNKSKEFPTELVGTSIAVGVDSVAVTDSQQDNVQFYTDSNTNIIRATDFASKILADVTYTDGTTESDVDITRLVDCHGATPKELYDKQAKNGFFSSPNMPLYYNGKLLKWKTTDKNVTQNIMVGKRGDLNFDGGVDSTDIFYLSLYIAQKAVGMKTTLYTGTSTDANMEDFAFYLMDFDTLGQTSTATLDSTDIYYLLLYVANRAVGNHIAWDSFVL